MLATVAAGLYVSWNGLHFISAATRLQGIFFWDVLTYLIDGLVFLVTGLQARTLLAGIGGRSLTELAVAAAIVSGVVIVARFVWTFPATYLPRVLVPAIARRDPSPPWQWPFALAFTGVRGIVSLAAALAIPLATEGGQPFPYRDLVLFLTFAVILVTLVGQGLLLPTVIGWLGLAHAGRRERRAARSEELDARQQSIAFAIERLEEIAGQRALPGDVVHALRAQLRDRLKHFVHGPGRADGHREHSALHDDIERLLLGAEREHINALFREGVLKDESRRRIERELDLRDASLANHEHGLAQDD